MATFQEKYGPWALVTGASSGIGAEFCRQIAARGLNVILVARSTGKLETLAEQPQQEHKVETRVVTADLGQADFMEGVLAQTEGLEVGLLVNNAGFGIAGEFLDNPMERELQMLHVNCRAPLMLTHAFGNKMRERGKGGVVMVASTIAYQATPYMAHYTASKAHNLFFGESIWYELKQTGIDVITLCPGPTDTQFADVAVVKAPRGMSVTPVVRLTLAKLGRRPRVIPGLLNRFGALMSKFAPRRLNAVMMGWVMRKLIEKKQ